MHRLNRAHKMICIILGVMGIVLIGKKISSDSEDFSSQLERTVLDVGYLPWPTQNEMDLLNRYFRKNSINAFAKYSGITPLSRASCIYVYDANALWWYYSHDQVRQNYLVERAASNQQRGYVPPDYGIALEEYTPTPEFQQFIDSLRTICEYHGYSIGFVPYSIRYKEYVKLIVSDRIELEYEWKLREANSEEITAIELKSMDMKYEWAMMGAS